MVVKDRFFLQRKSKKHSTPAVSEEITSDEESAVEQDVASSSDSEASDQETAASKRLRLAKEYLENLQQRQDEFSTGALQADREIISKRLKSDQLESSGRLFRTLSDRVNCDFPQDPNRISILKGAHARSVTQVAISECGTMIFSASKDCSIVKWDVESGKRQFSISIGPKSSSNSIFALALSSDAKFLAAGSQKGTIYVYSLVEASNNKFSLLKTFTQHKDSVTGLAFRRGNAQLFSGSLDRSVKLWNMESLTFVETLFGHQEGILDIDSLTRERCISVAGRDRSLHLYKIIEESQLIFRADDYLTSNEDGCSGRGGSIDCCTMIDEEHFVCGSDGGHLLIFSIAKKKPLLVLKDAHEDNANAVSCIGKVLFSDILITGSQSGRVKVWKIGEKKDSLTCLSSFLVNGIPNAISTSFDGKILAIAVGKEPRLGRWETKEQALNAVYVYRMMN